MCVQLLLEVLLTKMDDTFKPLSCLNLRHGHEQDQTILTDLWQSKRNLLSDKVILCNQLSCRLYHDEVSKSKTMNELLGIGVGAFQGMANLAINGLALVVLYYGGSLLAAQEMEPGDLMSFLVATQTIQRYIQ